MLFAVCQAILKAFSRWIHCPVVGCYFMMTHEFVYIHVEIWMILLLQIVFRWKSDRKKPAKLNKYQFDSTFKIVYQIVNMKMQWWFDSKHLNVECRPRLLRRGLEKKLMHLKIVVCDIFNHRRPTDRHVFFNGFFHE